MQRAAQSEKRIMRAPIKNFLHKSTNFGTMRAAQILKQYATSTKLARLVYSLLLYLRYLLCYTSYANRIEWVWKIYFLWRMMKEIRTIRKMRCAVCIVYVVYVYAIAHYKSNGNSISEINRSNHGKQKQQNIFETMYHNKLWTS